MRNINLSLLQRFYECYSMLVNGTLVLYGTRVQAKFYKKIWIFFNTKFLLIFIIFNSNVDLFIEKVNVSYFSNILVMIINIVVFSLLQIERLFYLLCNYEIIVL